MNVQVAYFAASKAYQKGQYLPALQILNNLLDVSGDAKNYLLLAKTLIKLNMLAEAAGAYHKAAETGCRRADEYFLRAMELYAEAGEDDNALLAAKTLAHKALEDPNVAFVLATIFKKRGQQDLLAGLRKPLINSADIRHINLAVQLSGSDTEDDRRTFANAVKRMPKQHCLRFAYHYLLRINCEFDQLRASNSVISAQLRSGDPKLLAFEAPWTSITWCGDERLNALCKYGAPSLSPIVTQRRRAMVHKWGDRKIRIGYLSADFFSTHATMKLLGDVLHRHDRDRFEIYLFCCTPKELIQHNKVERSKWGRVVTVSDLSDAELTATIRAHAIDIIVDLKGHTKHTRSAALNQAAAPIQVAWLGFPGSTLGIDLDYVIGDRFVLPETSKPFYHEKFCRLPDTYQPNDPSNRPFPYPVSRQSVGLPDDVFVFASFNQPHKISAEMVALWSRILKKAPESVLWLMTRGRETSANLIKEFSSHKIGPDRIVFAEKIEYEEHINRQGCADIGLDTYPCNGHTTTSDSLWAGLPVLTHKGTNFASRVSESLLNAIGLPELVAVDAEDYVEKAIELYENRHRISEYKKQIEQARLLMPLFDSERFCSHLEAAYETMVERAKARQMPAHFDVPALPLRQQPFASLPASRI